MERWFENNRLKRKIAELEKEIEKAKQDVAREIFEEVEKALAQHSYAQCFQGEVCATSYFDYDLEDSLAELKKKYIGE